MNTQTYRVIFSKARGCFMAVGENARSNGGGGCSGTRRSRRKPCRLTRLGLLPGGAKRRGGTSVAVVAGNIDLANASVQSAGWLKLQTTQGELNLAATQVKAAGDVTLQSAGALNLTAQKHEAHVVRGDGSKNDEVKYETTNIQAGGNATLTSQRDLTAQGSTITAAQDLKLQSTGGSVDLQTLKNSSDTRTTTTTAHTETVQGPQLQAGGNAQVLAAQNLSAQSLQLQAGGNATLAAAGTLALTSEQAYSRTTTGSDVRQSLQTERTQIQAAGNAMLYGQQGVQIDAADVQAGGNARVSSQGSVVLGANTDTEQRNWTTSSSSSSWGGLKTKTTTTQHQTLDQEAERTRIQAGNEAVVLGQNVGSVGAQVSGKTLTQIEGADQTKLYDVQEVHQYTANSQTRKGFLGITYSKSSSQDSQLQSNALPTELKSDQAVRVGVGAVTDVRGAVLTAPQVEFYRSANADTTKPGELILGASTNTTETSHTEKTTTAGVWQAQSGKGQTSQTANQTQINGQLVIGQGIQTKVQIPEGALKTQIEALSQQPGQAYLAELASNPQVNWEQIKLEHDQWQYSQQGLTGAGAALLAIVVAYFTAGMGTALVGTTTSAAGAAGASTTAVAGTTLATTSAATATAASAVTYSAAGAALNAGFSALASSAAVSFVNNGGDLGQTLKELGSKDSVKNILISMATAGALNELGNANLIGNKALSQITAADGFTANLGKNLINNMASATMNSALTGAKLEDSFKTALTSAVVSAGAGQAASTIGDMTQDSPAVKALAHALAGCVAGAAGSGSQGCQSGAIGAVVGELAAQWVNPDGLKSNGETLEFVRVVSAVAGAMTGDGSAQSVNTAVMTGVNAAENNRLLHFDEKERIRLVAGGDAAKQERLTKAACFEVKCWAQYPEGSALYKANYVSVAEMGGMQAEWDWVKGQKSLGTFIYTPTQQFTDWVAASTGLATGTLRGKVLGTSVAAITSPCANGDTGCITGIGQQQNAPLTEAEKKARAEYFGSWSTEYQRSANLAATMRLPQVALSYEIASGVTALLEQAYQPSMGKVLVEPSLDKIADEVAKRSGIPLVIVQEVVNNQIKPSFKNLIDTIDTAAGLK